jgi:hypothetical protein
MSNAAPLIFLASSQVAGCWVANCIDLSTTRNP